MTRKRKRNDPYGTCEAWPDCICYNQICKHWRAIDNWEIVPPTWEEIDDLRLMIFVTLSCVAHNCWDKAYRRAATLELMKPVYNAPRRETWQ
jgi:hypothetical protein